jgi:hypothetical protein
MKLREVLDSNDSFIVGGHQIVHARSYKRETPAWVTKNSEIRKLLLRSFPRLATNERQKRAAARWAMIIHLFYHMGYTSSQVAEEMGLALNKVKAICKSIRRVSKGLRADGRGKLTGKLGRPKKHAPK